MGRKRTQPILDRSKLDPEVRQRIQQAAQTLFAGRDLHDVGLDEVARAANASLQTIYRYYNGKEELLFACLADHFDELGRLTVDHLKGIENYKDRLRKLFWVYLDYFEQNPEVVQLLMTSVHLNRWMRDPSFVQPQAAKAMMEVLAEGRRKGILTEAVSEPILLDYFWGVLFRLVGMNSTRQRREPLSEQAPVLFEMIWRAIARPEPAAPVPGPAAAARRRSAVQR